MPGDELHEEAGGPVSSVPDAGNGRTGPRHAAPRKPLLNRFHVPAGKAIAIAAMPSAVLMGMGLTPQLASAKPMPKNPFKSGPCVSQKDRDEAKEKAQDEKEQKEQKAKQEREREKLEKKAETAKKRLDAAKEAKEKQEKDGASDSGSGSSDSGSGSDAQDPKGSTGSDSGTDSGSGSDSEKGDNPLDPLGVGDKLDDLLTPKEEKEKAAQDASDSDAKSSADSGTSDAGSGSDSGSDSQAGAGSKSAEDPTKPVGDAVNKAGDGLKDTTDKLGDAAGDATKEVGKAGDEVGKATDKLPTAGGANGSEDGKKAFPCVEEKKTGGKDEQTPVTLPNDPFELQSSKLALHGLNYEGVRNVTTADGTKKQVLKFTADSLDIGDLHQIVPGPGGIKYHVRASEGSNSSIRGGKVTMYTERLQGNLFGLIPVVFDPEHPPPINVPEALFTKVKVTQAGQFGGNLTVPGLRTTIGH